MNYVLVVLLGVHSANRSFTYLAALVSTALVVAGYLTNPDAGSEPEPAAIHRACVIALIWVAASLCIHLQRRLAAQHRLRSDSAEKLAVADSQRRPGPPVGEQGPDWAASHDAAFYALAKVAEARDGDTGQHVDRIRAYCHILALEMQKDPMFARVIDDRFLDDLYRCSPLHDIGKVAIPDAILLKTGRLTPEEFEVIKQHTVIGGGILEDVIGRSQGGALLEMGAVIAKCHHERFDGQGYPAGLSGRAIPVPARIVALADVFDALTSDRPYKKAYPAERARQMIIEESGQHFDPIVVEAFLRCYDDILSIQLRYPNRYTRIFGITESLLAEVCR